MRVQAFSAWFCVVALSAASLAAQSGEVLTNEAVVKMVVGKVDRAIIAAKVAATPNTFDVSPAGLIYLHASRVPSALVVSMLQTQPKTPVLTNQGVVDMVTAKLPESLVLQKIQVSRVEFDDTTDGIVALTAAKVSPKIIKAMVAARTAASAPPFPPASKSTTEPQKAASGSGGPGIALEHDESGRVNKAPAKVADGEAATLVTSLSVTDALSKVKGFFNSKNIDFTVNADTNRVISDWHNERGCGPGFNKCADRASVRVTSEGGRTTVIVQVFERKREAGISPKPWNENAKSKGKATAELAAVLSSVIR